MFHKVKNVNVWLVDKAVTQLITNCVLSKYLIYKTLNISKYLKLQNIKKLIKFLLFKFKVLFNYKFWLFVYLTLYILNLKFTSFF